MNWFQKWLMRRWFKKLLRGQVYPTNKGFIAEVYSLIGEAAENEYREDNRLSLNSFLRECHEHSLDRMRDVGQLRYQKWQMEKALAQRIETLASEYGCQ